MVKKTRHSGRFWRDRHSKETRLRLSLGQSRQEISDAIGFCRRTVGKHIETANLDAPLSLSERVTIACELEADKTIIDALGAQSGSVAQARFRAGLKALSEKPNQPRAEQEFVMRSLKEIREMSGDELRAYVASLVPGLESKATPESQPDRGRTHGALPLPADSASRPKTAGAHDKLA